MEHFAGFVWICVTNRFRFLAAKSMFIMFHVASLKDEAECWVSREGIADEDMWMQYTVSRHF